MKINIRNLVYEKKKNCQTSSRIFHAQEPGHQGLVPEQEQALEILWVQIQMAKVIIISVMCGKMG